MVHFLNCITLQVSVPVLSEKMYFTCEGSWKKTVVSFYSFIIYSEDEVDEASYEALFYSFTWPSSSLRLEVLAIAGVFVGSYSISVS